MPAPPKKPPLALTDAAGIAIARKLRVNLTHPERLASIVQGISKARLVAYYEAVAPRMLPHISRRPLSLVRNPGGGAHPFFQKHESPGFPSAFERVPITEKDGDTQTYMFIESLEGLVAGAQMDTLEFHIWGSRVEALEKPDRLVFDMDPDEGLDFAHVCAAALEIRDRLAGLGLVSFPMVTGGKGIHAVVPVLPALDWPEVKRFCKGFAQRLEADTPERFTAALPKAKRQGKVFVDYLRNERGSTAIAPFSTRARNGAPCAVPIGWDEVAMLERANGFSIVEAAARARAPDPWPDYFNMQQSITEEMLDAVVEMQE